MTVAEILENSNNLCKIHTIKIKRVKLLLLEFSFFFIMLLNFCQFMGNFLITIFHSDNALINKPTNSNTAGGGMYTTAITEEKAQQKKKIYPY